MLQFSKRLLLIFACLFSSTALPQQIEPAEFSGVLTGIDVLQKEAFQLIEGKKIGLITNHSGKNRSGVRNIDLLFEQKSHTLVRLFSPEHGLGGNENRDDIGNSIDQKTGLTIISLYGAQRAPLPEQIRDLDILLFDIQDVGARFFTYISTMKLAMQVAAQMKVKFLVLDRPNPNGGILWGGVNKIDQESFVSIHDIPLLHGMTMGEIAELFKRENFPTLELEVVKLKNWNRKDYWENTQLPWINPSPALKNMKSVFLYPATAQMEFVLSVGRGTDKVFEQIGAPYIDPQKFLEKLNDLKIEGVRFTATTFIPTYDIYKNQRCGGVFIEILNRDLVNTAELGLMLAHTVNKLYPRNFDLSKFNVLVKHAETIEDLSKGRSLNSILRNWRSENDLFNKRRSAALLY